MTREEVANALETLGYGAASAPDTVALVRASDAVRALPVIATCGECTSCSYDVREDGQRPRWVCRHGNRFVSRGEPPPGWCPLRGKR